MRDRPFSASGFQIAFLVFAVVFLGAPAQKYLGPLVAPTVDLPNTLGRLFFFVPAVLLLVLIPGIRRYCADLLRSPIPKSRRREIALVVGANVLFPFAIVGGVVLWFWLNGGEMALARRLGQQETAGVAMTRALSPDGIAFFILTAAIAPVVEELVFRGMLFRAWEAEWGGFKSLIATSIVFAAYHPAPAAAFFGSILLTTLYWRTGSIRACIVAHVLHNALLWYPLMGQFVFRTAGRETGEIALWPFHLAALALATIALPVYVWMARNPAEDRPTADEPHAAARC